MIRRHFSPLLPLLAAAVACQTAAPSRRDVPPPAALTQAELRAACEAAHEQVDLLLEQAQEAAASSRIEEAMACEEAVFTALALCSEAGLDDQSHAAYIAQVLDDLEQIADLEESGDNGDQVAEAPEAEEVPPEPQPVSEAEVVAEQEKAREAEYDLPVVVNAEVTSLIEFYSGAYRERFSIAMERAGRYLPFIREELRKARLPADLAYLPFVESAFNARARSRARAQGLWQFMSGTARLYDLHCDPMVDERNDPYLATTAAVAHLAELQAMFGKWDLALAAYNSGGGRVQRALRRAKGSTDEFWKLRRYLPRETRNYVPAFWAVLVIVKNPVAYGFAPIVENPECLGRVTVAGALDLDVLAERAQVDVELLAEINPALIHRMTPIDGSYQLAVPCGHEERYATVLASIPRDERVRSFVHIVRRGDTLGSIARRYGSSVETIRAANAVRNPRSLKIGQSLVIPRHPGSFRSAAAAERTASSTARSSRSTIAQRQVAQPDRYKVRRGDSLYSIARKFGVSVDRIKSLNGLTSNIIKPGQWLRLVAM